ncbi:MAG: threonine aldolase family protein, partial [Candidatus Puniceispirillaceae bacterium]
QVVPLAKINAAARRARDHCLLVHFDGARLMNACVKLGVSPAEMLAEVDSVSLCLSKGLGTPAGSILAGSREMIRRAHRVRKLVGGGMRQVGILAAAGIYALDHHIDRLAEDHANAVRLAERLSGIAQITVDPGDVETNMVFAGLPEGAAGPLQAHLRDRGILINRDEPRIRLVTHLDCRADEIDLFVEEVQSFFA